MRIKHKPTQSLLSILILFILTVSSFNPPAVQAQGSGGLKRQVNSQTGRLSFLLPERGLVLPAGEALRGMPLADRRLDPVDIHRPICFALHGDDLLYVDPVFLTEHHIPLSRHPPCPPLL